MNFNRFVKFVLGIAAFMVTTTVPVLAQCAMCKANIANAETAAEVSGKMNSAVLVLLVPTLLIIGGIVHLVFKYRHSTNEISPNSYVNFRPSDAQRDSQ